MPEDPADSPQTGEPGAGIEAQVAALGQQLADLARRLRDGARGSERPEDWAASLRPLLATLAGPAPGKAGPEATAGDRPGHWLAWALGLIGLGLVLGLLLARRD